MTPAALHTRSPRALAGARANKHRPVARRTRSSDELVQNWRAIFGPAAVRAERSGDFDDARLLRLLASEDRDPGQGSRPDHSARAVDIDACFGSVPAGDSQAAAARRAGDCGRFAAPMTALRRAEVYERQRGVLWVSALTPAQRRRLNHKARSVGELAGAPDRQGGDF